MAKKERQSFEEALSQLEEIVNELEDDSITLERSLSLYEEGIKLSKICTETLENARQQIEHVNEQHNDNKDDE